MRASCGDVCDEEPTSSSISSGLERGLGRRPCSLSSGWGRGNGPVTRKFFRSGDFFAVGEDTQALAFAKMQAGLVEKNRQVPSVIRNLIEAEIIPRLRHKGIDLDRVVTARSQADQAADHEVAECRMVVILAALHAAFAGIPCAVLPGLQARPRDPVAVGRILVFIDPRHDAAVVKREPLRLGVDSQELEVLLPSDRILRRTVQQVREPGQRDRRGVRPNRPVPLALVTRVRECKFRMPLLSRRQPERRVETLRIHGLFPRHGELRIGQIKIPGRETVQFAHTGA